ncbi:MAG TPA: hypothetical protein VK826_05135 [Bacteroidia bacterium]|nr:hypothetical protein [Bacteroidia bacterium]
MKSTIDYSDSDYFAKQYTGFAKWKFNLKVKLGFRKANRRLRETLRVKECYYGPFKGEFGHFLAHNLPFLAYLHRQGVKIHYCGMEIHKPFLVDENGKSIIHEWYPLRDFFAEVSPACNRTVAPADVETEIQKWKTKARASSLPFYELDDEYYYWFIHRIWLMTGPYMQGYRLDKVYWNKPKENSVCIFPRTKGAKTSKNNGGPWDYPELVKKLSPHFDKIYVCGHPSQVLVMEPFANVELCVTADNAVILEKCSRSRLIITQHSGVNNLGEYTDAQVLIIYNGEGPIGSMQNTQRFRPFLVGGGKKELHPLAFAFLEREVIEYVAKL